MKIIPCLQNKYYCNLTKCDKYKPTKDGNCEFFQVEVEEKKGE